jgi:hypothetical protein
LNALGCLLAVGSEWASYATIVPTGGARKAARAAADEASEQLGRQGAWQASRELKPVVIGENMERVRAYARMRGAMTINDWIPSPQWTFEKNMQWVRQIIAEGREVIDIGPDFLRRASTGRASGVYEMERRLLKGYPNYVRDFQRWHRLQGGNPYVDPWVHFLRTAGQP